MDIEVCDMCGKKIINQRCDCGIWHTKEETKNNPIKESLEEFDKYKRFALTADIPHLGCAAVFFRGDYNDTQKVLEFIYCLKNRPFYQE